MSADDFGVGDLFRNLAAETQAAVARDTAPYYRRFHGMRDELLERLDNRIHPLVRARSRSHQCGVVSDRLPSLLSASQSLRRAGRL